MYLVMSSFQCLLLRFSNIFTKFSLIWDYFPNNFHTVSEDEETKSGFGLNKDKKILCTICSNEINL